MTDHLRIVHFHAENVKKLRVVDFVPDSHVVVVAGDNAQGKTAVLDSILYALGGGRTLPPEPVRRGEHKAKITLDLGAFSVERRFRKKGDYLTITAKDGAVYKSPQSMLDALMDTISFDPVQWLRKRPQEQRAELLELAGIDINTNRVERTRVYEQRTQTNRSIKQAEGRLADLEPVAMPEQPTRPRADVLAEWETANAREQEHALAQDAVHRATTHVETCTIALRNAEETLEWERQRLAETSTRRVDVAALKDDLDRASRAEQAHQMQAHYDRANAELERLKTEANDQSARIEQLDRDLRAALEAADFPVAGLSVDEEYVLFNGLPLTQASQAEQLRVALAVAMRLQQGDRRIAIARILDGSLLDEQSMATVRAMAEQHDFQVWIERVEKDGASIIIEDGQVAE